MCSRGPRIAATRGSIRDSGGIPSLVWIAAAAALALAALATACGSVEDVPPLERRAQELNKAIMCPVCPGESIDQSQNPLASQMRNIVAEKLEQGWTEDQIKDFFVERYGPSVLLEPPRNGFNLLVWVLPPVGGLGAIIAAFMVLRMMRRVPVPQSQETGAVQLSDDERDEYFRRVEAVLENDVLGRLAERGEEAPGPEAEGVA
uniref:Putative cytochrome C biogenesis protein n=1 Tax=uncultured marine microorganism HF4000_APKG8C21 TaxID=455553 RepID=B3TA18_9ZZZZ|nr:putative cytochrome C biogenesis protein [uncultured marine microorganism HF4000_APKG8C21]